LLLGAGLALAVAWLGRLVTAEAWFDSRAYPWGFVMENVALGAGSVRLLRFSPVTFSPPIRNTLLHLDATSIRRTSGRIIGTLKERGVVSDVREHFPGKYCHILFSRSLLHFLSFVKEWGK